MKCFKLAKATTSIIILSFAGLFTGACQSAEAGVTITGSPEDIIPNGGTINTINPENLPPLLPNNEIILVSEPSIISLIGIGLIGLGLSRRN